MDLHRNHPTVRLPALLLLLAPLLAPLRAHGEADYAPQICPASELELEVRNPGSEPEPFWLQVREDGRLVQEIADEANPGETLRRAGADFLAGAQTFSVRQRGSRLRFTLNCAGSVALTPATSPRADFDLRGQRAPLLVRVQNLHHSAQLVAVRFLAADGRVLAETSLALPKSYVSVENKLEIPAGAARLRLDGEARLNSRLLNSTDLREIPALTPVPAEIHVPASRAYFLLTNDGASESFVVSTDNADLADQARDLIRRKSYKITFALAEAAPAANENRDFVSAGAPPWSWRAKELYGFNDLGHQDCSGSPSMLEDRVVAGAERMICFWSFRLRRELTADEVRTGLLRKTP